MNPLALSFIAVLGDFVIKASLAALKEYQAREDIKQGERDKATIQHKDFVITYQDYMLRATLNPDLYDQLQHAGGSVGLPTRARTTGGTADGVLPDNPS